MLIVLLFGHFHVCPGIILVLVVVHCSTQIPLLLLFVQHCRCFGHCLHNGLVVLSAFSIIGIGNHVTLWRLFCSFYLGVDVCATLFMSLSFFHYQCCFVCDALAVFWLLWYECLCYAHGVLIIASTMVLLFM